MSLEFETIKISDFVNDMKNGGTPRRNVAEYWEEGTIPWLKTGEINNEIITENSEYITEEGLSNSSAKLLPINSVIMALYGKGTAGRVGLLKFEATTNQACCAMICEDKIKSEYLFFYLLSIQPQIELLANGSVQQNLSKDILAEYEIQVPKDYNVMKQIVWILKNIDKKIENNKQINHNLDKTIRELYNSWFVDFLPFQNQEFKDTYMGKIPNEWEIKNLDEICDKISDSYKPDSEEVVLIQTSDVSKGIVLNHEKVPNDDYKGHFKYKFEKNDILYTQIRPKNERYAFINFDPINYVASTQLMVLRAKSGIIPPYILYLFLTSRDMIMEVNLLAESRSGTFPQINFNEIKHEKVIVAPFKVYESFWNIIRSLVEKKFINDDEIIKLTQLRDILLPKLMSGEIDVSQINCDLD